MNETHKRNNFIFAYFSIQSMALKTTRRENRTLFESVMTLGCGLSQGPLSYVVVGLSDMKRIGTVCKFLAGLCYGVNAIQAFLKKNMTEQLKKYNMKLRDFSKALILTSGILGGGIILQCAQGEHYTKDWASKLDIYVPPEGERAMVQYIEKCGYKIRQKTVARYNGEFRRDTIEDEFILHSWIYYQTEKKRTIDLVVLCRQYERPRLVIAEYDFTFLMNLYDGTKFELWFPEDIVAKNGRYNPVS
jgi:hypothetical protein